MTYEGTISGELKANGENAYFKARLDYEKVCESDPVAEGCQPNKNVCSSWNHTVSNSYILKSGVSIGSLNNDSGGDNRVTLDMNGPNKGSNTEGEDTLCITLYTSPHAKAGKIEITNGTQTLLGFN